MINWVSIHLDSILLIPLTIGTSDSYYFMLYYTKHSWPHLISPPLSLYYACLSISLRYSHWENSKDWPSRECCTTDPPLYSLTVRTVRSQLCTWCQCYIYCALSCHVWLKFIWWVEMILVMFVLPNQSTTIPCHANALSATAVLVIFLSSIHPCPA